jgi:integrase
MKLKAMPGEVLTADAARRLANRILVDVAHVKDPQGETGAKRRESTVADLCDLYLEEGTETKKPSTLATDKGRIERYIEPLLGHRPIAEISGADVERFMRDVAKGRTAADVKTGPRGRAVVEGGKGTATRTVGLLGGVFSFAVRRKLCTDNPVRGVKRYADRKGERFLSARELAALGETLRDFEADGANPYALAIIRLLTVTGARKSEIAALRWSEMDADRQYLRLGDSKSGAKVVPLGPPALAVLAGLPREGDYVFPAETGTGHFQGTEKLWRKLREAAGLADVRLHDFRHSFASMGLVTGDALAVIGKLLGHADVKTTARYAHLADDPLKTAASRISGTIAAAMAGGPDAEVAPLARRQGRT